MTALINVFDGLQFEEFIYNRSIIDKKHKKYDMEITYILKTLYRIRKELVKLFNDCKYRLFIRQLINFI